MSIPSGPEVVVIGLVLVIALIVMAFVTLRRRDSPRHLPILAEVGDLSTGVLACPVCRCASFQTPPGGPGSFFALALGPFVFGSLSSSGLGVVECVSCATRFARGSYVPAEGSEESVST
jgi:hypothetical protein